ncbi:hypothetical protein GE194_23240 (plasmid) [Salmonella enterica subsp. enterica serovar Anatum]|nr:hypothetical protein GE194_23240 [Salmonella enterica subsp. enterica serovar Anatum]
MKTTCHAAGITAAPLSPQEWRALLRAKGWKQKELARRWNVSETWISKLANNPDRGTHWNDACRGLPGHCCKVSDEAAFCLIQRPYISKTLLTRRISPRGSP